MRAVKYLVLGVLCMSVVCGTGYALLSKICGMIGLRWLPSLLREHYIYSIVSFGAVLGLLYMTYSDELK